MEITFGALAEPLHKQLGEPEDKLELLQRAADSVAYLSIHGFLSESETHSARKRIVKEIGRLQHKYIETGD